MRKVCATETHTITLIPASTSERENNHEISGRGPALPMEHKDRKLARAPLCINLKYESLGVRL